MGLDVSEAVELSLGHVLEFVGFRSFVVFEHFELGFVAQGFKWDFIPFGQVFSLFEQPSGIFLDYGKCFGGDFWKRNPLLLGSCEELFEIGPVFLGFEFDLAKGDVPVFGEIVD